MRLLLDTHVYLWCVNDDRKLSAKARALIMAADEVYVSSASIWEAAIKVRLKKLNVNINDLVSAISKSGFLELAVSSAHAATTAQLPDIHRDPFDRILIAQAITEPLRFLTVDAVMKQYSDLVELI
jgi:PIN domain nuclease of toxin-antitoxin system